MRRRLARTLAVVLGAAVACLSRPALVPDTFSIDPPPAREGPAAAGGRVVALRAVEMAPQFEGRSLLYRTGDHRLERDPYASFAAAPADMLTAAIREYLRRSELVRDVVEPGSEVPADVLVQVYASELSGDLRRADDAAGVMTLQLAVLPARGEPAQPLLQKEYTRRIRLPRRTADAVVAAWNQGLGEMMAEFVRDLEAVLPLATPP